MSEEGDVVEAVVDDATVVADMIERPENVPEKFWDNDSKAVRNDDVLKSYNELSGKFGSFTGAPEAYEFSLNEQLTENGVELDLENPLISQFSELAKEAGMNGDMANQLVNMFVEGQYAGSLSLQEAETSRQAEEMGKLGDGAQQRIDNISKWASANLSPEQVNGLTESATTAAGIQAIEALIAQTKNSSIVANDATPVEAGLSLQALNELKFARDEQGNLKASVDPEYRKMVTRKFEEAYPGDNLVTVG